MSRTIALVDGGEALDQLREALADFPDWEIRPCPLAEDTLSCLRQSSPDVVVVNLEVPEAAGVNLIRLLWDDPATVDLPVVVCIPQTQGMRPHLADLHLQGLHVLYRPFQPTELREAVRQAVEHRRPS